MGPITSSLSPATQSDILGILQREQDHAVTLLSLSPLLSSLFVSYAHRAAALESTSSTHSTESEQKAHQTAVAAFREENERLKLENLDVARRSEAVAASQETFRAHISSLKEVIATQQNDIKSLRAELVEGREKHDRLVVERAALQIQVIDLEASVRVWLSIERAS